MHRLLLSLLAGSAALMSVPAFAQAVTVFTFPDPAITNFRLTSASLNYDGGIQPWVRIGYILHAGDVVNISGQADLDGGNLRLSGCGTASANVIVGSDPFTDQITCTADGSYVQLMGQSYYTVGRVNSLTVTVTHPS
jgi:hypothetical protein